MAAKKGRGPKPQENSLSDWMDVIHQQGERFRTEQKQLREERAQFLRSHFAEDKARIADLGEDTLMTWKNSEPVLNMKFADLVLGDERALNILWDEIARRTEFEYHLRSHLKLEVPE